LEIGDWRLEKKNAPRPLLPMLVLTKEGMGEGEKNAELSVIQLKSV